MPQTDFIHHPPHPGPLLKGLGVVAGVAAISVAAALCYEQYRRTPGADAVLNAAGIHPIQLLARHVHGDWGDLSVEDRAANALPLQTW